MEATTKLYSTIHTSTPYHTSSHQRQRIEFNTGTQTTGFSPARACTSTQETHTHIAHKSTNRSSPPIPRYVLFTVFLAIDHNHYHHRWSLFTSSLSSSLSLFSCLGRLSLLDLRLPVSYNNDGQRCHESAEHLSRHL